MLNVTISQAYKLGIDTLKNFEIEAPAREAGALLCFAAKLDYTAIFAHGDNILPNEIFDYYKKILDKRCNRIPFQYITGHQEFMSLDFIVNEHVLVPRADTEVLVETVLNYVKASNSIIANNSENDSTETLVEYTDKNLKNLKNLKNSKTFSILDIGTGSGCIAVSIAYYVNNVKVTALDISKHALETATKNADINKVSSKIQFINYDILSDKNEFFLPKNFDIIVSNPPYIPSNDVACLQPEVSKYEPLSALDGGFDGLIFYKEIIAKSNTLLKRNGLIAFEIGAGQEVDVIKLMSFTFYSINTYKDISGHIRVVTGLKK
jgi:release factor glutamine methyltransferase